MALTSALTPTREPWIAAVLSLLCTGLGHLYAGRPARGLALFLVSLLLTPLFVLASQVAPASWVLVVMLAACIGVLAIYAFAVFDSWRWARRLRDAPLRDYHHVGLYALFVIVGLTYPAASAWLVRSTAFEAFCCPASSMIPAVRPGDRFLVNKHLDGHGTIHRGDLIVHRNPEDRREHFIKRVAALAGDSIEIRGQQVILNGKPLATERVSPEAAAPSATLPAGTLHYETHADARYLVLLTPRSKLPDVPETRVPPGTCFVLGDNRDNSHDSRSYGCVPLGDVVGTVQYLYWPADSWSRFGPM